MRTGKLCAFGYPPSGRQKNCDYEFLLLYRKEEEYEKQRVIPTPLDDDSSIIQRGWYCAPGWPAAARQTKTNTDPR